MLMFQSVVQRHGEYIGMVTVRDVEEFCEASTYLKIIYCHFATLFEEGPKRLQLLEDSAHAFFFDMQYVLISFLLLQVCKLTDPATMMKKDNLTVDFFIRNMDPALDAARSEQLHARSAAMHSFREKILPARNQRISHLDRNATLANADLGGFKYGEFETFLQNLEAFINILHEHYCGSPRDLGSYSDAFELIDALRKAKFFEEIAARDDAQGACREVRLNSEYRRS